MGEKYIVFLPTNWEFMPADGATERLLEALHSRGIIQGDLADPTSLRNGASYNGLFKDPDPKPALDGNGMGADPGNMEVRIDQGTLCGYVGENMEPVACDACNSELPYEEAQDGFYALMDGEEIDGDRYQMECYHCNAKNSAFTADYGQSAGYSHWALVFTGETSNRIEANPEGMKLIEETIGSPIKFIQVFNW